jgi:putative spermidine/putrescine transport system substrate-binding protein
MVLRRSLMLAALAAGALIGGVAQAQEPRFDGVTLRIATFGGNWRDFMRDDVAAELEKRGAKVEFLIGSPAENLAKLVAARGRATPFDVFEVMDATLNDVLEGQFLQKLNVANVPNVAALRKDQYNDLMVAAWTTQEGVVYNAEKFKELGLEPPKKYADLLNPKLAGRVAFPDITSGGGVAGIAGVNKELGGKEANIEPTMNYLKQLKPQGLWKAGGNVVTQFRSGDVWAALINAGWGIQGIKAGLPLGVEHIKFADGKQGVVKLGWWAIPKGTSPQVQRAAEFMINRFLDVPVQENMMRNHGLVAVNGKTLEIAAQDQLLKRTLLLSPAEVANFYAPDFKQIDMTNWLETWNKGIASR